jgi:hypothetical protein
MRPCIGFIGNPLNYIRKRTDGGYILNRTPEEISLLEVIEAIDGPLSAILPNTNGDAVSPVELRLHEALEHAAGKKTKVRIINRRIKVEVGSGNHGVRLGSLQIEQQYVIAAHGIAATGLHRDAQRRFFHRTRRGDDQACAGRVPFNTDPARQ